MRISKGRKISFSMNINWLHHDNIIGQNSVKFIDQEFSYHILLYEIILKMEIGLCLICRIGQSVYSNLRSP